jgi:hypothetical protein
MIIGTNQLLRWYFVDTIQDYTSSASAPSNAIVSISRNNGTDYTVLTSAVSADSYDSNSGVSLFTYNWLVAEPESTQVLFKYVSVDDVSVSAIDSRYRIISSASVGGTNITGQIESIVMNGTVVNFTSNGNSIYIVYIDDNNNLRVAKDNIKTNAYMTSAVIN